MRPCLNNSYSYYIPKKQTIGTPAQLPQERNPVELEFHPTPQLWVAYRGCGCEECPKGYGKTKEEAIADLEESTATEGSA